MKASFVLLVLIFLSTSTSFGQSCNYFFNTKSSISREVVTLETITLDVHNIVNSALRVSALQRQGSLVISSEYSFKDSGIAIDSVESLYRIVVKAHEGYEFNYTHFFNHVRDLYEITQKMYPKTSGLSLNSAKKEFSSFAKLLESIYAKHLPLSEAIEPPSRSLQ
ncbi:hypothetical protein N9W41_00705 [bacterium]|nr:hypothetical protein [bacterium]